MAAISGTSGNDYLAGTAGADSIEGFEGNDTIVGGAGPDTVAGGVGSDVLYGGDGDDQVTAQGVHAVLSGGDGDDALGHDAYGYAGATATIYGGAGNDRLWANPYSRVFFDGGPGDDQAYVNDDTILVGPGSGRDTVDLFSTGDNVVRFHASRFATFSDVLAATVEEGYDCVIHIDANTSVRLTSMLKAWLKPGHFAFDPNPLAPEPSPPAPPRTPGEYNGTDGDDTLLGSTGRDTLNGFAGNDSIDGEGGSDLIDGGAGDDTIVVKLGYGDVTLAADGSGDDTVQVGMLEDVAWVRNEAQVRRLRLTDDTTVVENRSSGGSFNVLQAVDRGPAHFDLADTDRDNLLAGDDAANRLDAGGGNDILYGNGGADVLLGGAGNDYLATGLDDATDDWFDGGGGTDTLSFSGATNGGVSVYMGAAVAVGAGIGRDRFFNVEIVIGSAGGDVLVGRDGVGDNLRGYWGDDWLYGFSLDDVLAGGEGQDVLVGGEDDDTLEGSEGDDWLYGGSGSNLISGGAGVDVLISQGNRDTLDGGDGDDYVYAYDSGITFADGAAGNDIFVMQSGPGVADGGEGHDYFYMGEASDTLRGGAGVDVLLGGGGYDLFDGGTGTDYLFLGGGSSTVVFRADSGADVVNGFKAEGSQHAIRFEGTRFTSIDEILAATYDFEGDALIRFDSDTVVWLVGVAKSQLSASDFAIA